MPCSCLVDVLNLWLAEPGLVDCRTGFSFTAAVAVSPSPAGAVAGYGDVSESTWYTDAVQWSVDNAIADIEGVCFGPDTAVSRGETAVWIHNMEDRPSAGAAHSFTDVTNQSQNDAVSWMADAGITTGTSPTTFAPDETLTRAQAATFLHRLAGEPAAPTHNFSDVVAGWQQDSVSWMAHTGITTGTSPTTFAPEGTLNRAQLITFLYRYQNEPDVTINPTTPTCQAPSTTESAADTPTTTTVWREATDRIPVEAVTTYVQEDPLLAPGLDPITYGASNPMRLEPGMRLVTDITAKYWGSVFELDGVWIIGILHSNNSTDTIRMYVCIEDAVHQGSTQNFVASWGLARTETEGVYQVLYTGYRPSDGTYLTVAIPLTRAWWEEHAAADRRHFANKIDVSECW